MSKEKFLKILKYSLIFGAVMGAISILPYIKIFSIIIMAGFSSICIIYYMQKLEEIGELTIKGAALCGAMIGFFSLVGFLIIFLPVSTILGVIFQYIFPNVLYFAGTKFLIGIWWLLILMGGLITALFNSFALISYVYIRDTYFMIEGKKEFKVNFEPRDKNGI